MRQWLPRDSLARRRGAGVRDEAARSGLARHWAMILDHIPGPRPEVAPVLSHTEAVVALSRGRALGVLRMSGWPTARGGDPAECSPGWRAGTASLWAHARLTCAYLCPVRACTRSGASAILGGGPLERPSREVHRYGRPTKRFYDVNN